MTPERGRERPEQWGNHNLICLLSGTGLLQTRPWILHGVATKGLILILINLVTVKGALKPNRSSRRAGHAPDCNILNKYHLKTTNVYRIGRSRSECQWH